MQRILPIVAVSWRSWLAANRAVPRLPIRGVPNTAGAAMAAGALATAASGPTNSVWPRSRVSAAIAKSMRCIGAVTRHDPAAAAAAAKGTR